MNFLELAAKLSLDSSQYESGLSRAKSLASSVSSGIGKVMKAGAIAIGAATTAAVAFGAASVKTGMDFDKSMSQVSATMGKTMEEMKNEVGSVETSFGHFEGTLRDFAQYMGRNTAFSATEAADALNYMALAGYNTQQSMEMLPNVLSLAAAGSFDLARASDMITDASTAFGLSISDNAPRINQLVDEMAKAASTGNTSVEQLGDAFLVVGGLAKELNGGFVELSDGTRKEVDGLQELEIALTAMANAGVKGSEAGTHMRNMIMKLSSPTAEGTKRLEAMGVSVFDAEGNMRSLAGIMGDLNGALSKMTQQEKIQAISELFNARDLASAEALLDAVGEDWDKIGESILDAQGAAAQMAETQLDNLAGDITLFKSALEGAKIAISDGLTPSLREFVQFGTDGLSRLTEAFKEGGMQGAMSEFGTLLSEGLNMLTENLPSFVDSGMALISSLGQGIIDNIPTLVDTGVEIVSKMAEYIIGALPKILEAGAEIISRIGTGIVNNLPTLIESAAEVVRSIAEGISENLPQIIGIAIEVITTIADGLIENIPLLADSAIEIIKKLADGIIEALPELIPVAMEIILNIASELINSIGTITDSAVDIMMALTDGLVDAIPALIEKVPEILMQLAFAFIENAPQLLFEVPIKIIVEIVKGLINNIPKLVEAGKNMVENLKKTIIERVAPFAERGAEIVTKIISGITQKIGAIKEKGRELVQKVKDGVMERVHEAVSWGRDLIQNFIDGITQKWQALKQKVSDVAQSVKDFLGFSEPKLGPLSNFHTYAPDMMELFAKGIRENAKVVTDEVEDAFDFGDMLEYKVVDSRRVQTNSADSVVIALLQEIRDNIGSNIVLSDGTLVGWMDKALGKRALQRARGNA